MNANNLLAPVNLAEAAYLSGLSRRDIDRVIDERIVPGSMIAVGGVRMVTTAACALARFYFQTAATLTADTRRRIVATMSERLLARSTGKNINIDHLTFDEGPVHVEFAGFLQDVIDARKQLTASEKMIMSDDDILGGEPVFKGTRVPVRQVAAALAEGESRERVCSAYPSLQPDMLDAASAWVRVHPARGRPPTLANTIPGAKLISRRIVKRRAG